MRFGFPFSLEAIINKIRKKLFLIRDVKLDMVSFANYKLLLGVVGQKKGKKYVEQTI